MARATYERETIKWNRADIDALVEAGRAQYFPGLPGYVIDKKTAVRNHQIVESLAQEAHRNAQVAALVEEYFTALHGPAENRDGEFWEAERDLYERLVNSEDGELEHSIREEIAELNRPHREDIDEGSFDRRAFDEDALFAKFGV